MKRATAIGLLLAAPCMAQTLPDPTRPPAEALLTPAALSAEQAPAGPRLQSVLIVQGQGGRRVAVIDGQTVRLGEKFKGALLVKMSDTEVVLRRGAQLETLKLFPKPAPAR
ncbi:MSHA biogenesis protein MshK [Janthinobacterium fluminis]|uniref:MSHA biogenesis protein MshK n=1 Tax=Janthinobacterium fluminis TaxID=2987524 RepID=A0ABT5K7J6_9BURK|nr:MSHA biogenesis protein MshK [Janthinobacterium fluminis]MDC8760393.1 MSHA biogenesis protein MshK [Janthinobacterium fluminis]